MEKTYEKIGETTLKVTKPVTTEVVENTYDLDFLNQQLIDIQKSKDDFDALRDRELEEVKNLIAQCEQLGIRSKIKAEDAQLEVGSEEILKDK